MGEHRKGGRSGPGGGYGKSRGGHTGKGGSHSGKGGEGCAVLVLAGAGALLAAGLGVFEGLRALL